MDWLKLADQPLTAPNLEWLAPTISTIGAIIIAALGTISLVWQKRQARQEQVEDKRTDAEIAATPKVVDGWDEVRNARAEATKYYNLYRVFEDLYYTVSAALRHLARLFHEKQPAEKIPDDVVEALAVKPPKTDSSS